MRKSKNKKDKKMKISSFATILAGFLMVPFFIFGQEFEPKSNQINVSAYISRVEGSGVENGSYSVRFAIYDRDRTEMDPHPSTTDTAVWQETQTVEIKNGYLDAYLGAENPIPDDLQFNEREYYLGIKIGEDSEVWPRKKIGAAPHALRAYSAQVAEQAQTLQGHIIGSSKGDILVLGNGGVIDDKFLPPEVFDTTDPYELPSKLSAKTFNGVTIERQEDGFTVGGGKVSRELTVTGDDIILDQDLSIAASPIFSGLTLRNELDVTSGGTGLSSYAEGDMLYATSSQALGRLGIGDAGQVLTVQNGEPTWQDAAAGTSYGAGGSLLQLNGSTFSVRAGTLTSGRACTYVTGTGLVCDTELSGASYTAGNDLDLSGTIFSLESQLDYVSVISRTSSDLTLQTTTSGNIILDPFGNVGIGTTLPGTKLEVSGVITATGGTSTNWNAAYGWGNHASAGYLTDLSSLTTDDLAQGATNLYSQWGTNGSSVYYNSGNVGIGTTSPDHKLFVAASSGNAAYFSSQTLSYYSVKAENNFFGSIGYLAGATYGVKGYVDANGASAIIGQSDIAGGYSGYFTGGKFYINSDVGIGTTSPDYTLDVQGGYVNASSGLCIGGTCIDSWSAGGVGQTYSAGSGLTLSTTTFKLGGTISENTNLNLYSSADYDLRFYNSNSSSEILFLDSSTGYVGMGTTNPEYKLDVRGTAAAGQINAEGGLCINGDCKTSWGDSGIGSDLWTQSGSDISYTAGNVGIGTTAPASLLDISGASNQLRITNSTSDRYAYFDKGDETLSLYNRITKLVSTEWTARTAAGSRYWFDVSMSSDGTKQTAIAQSSYIYTSTDSGETWTAQTSAGSRSWWSVAASSDGTKQTATASGGYIYTSTDSGETWTAQTSAGSRSWRGVAMSADGTKQTALASGGYIYTSTDSGVSWTEQTSAGSRNWYGVAMSADGTKQTATVSTGYIYISNDSGNTWTEVPSAGARSWVSVAMSTDGTKQTAVVDNGSNGYIYTSADSGASWTERTSAGSEYWRGVAMSADGTKQTAVAAGDYIYASTDSGTSWTAQASAGSRSWRSVGVSADGTKQTALDEGGYIYTANFVGSTQANVALLSSASSPIEDEAGILTVGDGGGRTVFDGKTLRFNIAGSEVAQLNASGYLGIGTTAPQEALDVVGDIQSSTGFCIGGDCIASWGESGVGQTYLAGSGLTLSTDTFKLGGTISENTNLNLYSSAAYDLRFYNSNSSSEMLFLDSSTGYIGIGTTAPEYKLDVRGTAAAGQINAEAGLCINGDCKTSWADSGIGSDLWTQSGSDISYIAGNVGIGTTAPQAGLHVASANIILGSGYGTATPSDVYIKGAAGAGTDVAGANMYFDASNGTGLGGSGSILFRTAAPTGGLPTYDNSTFMTGSNSSSFSFSHTVGSGQSNRLLIVTVTNELGNATSVTYNGTPLTRIVNHEAGDRTIDVWYLLNPSEGSHNVSITISESTWTRASATSYYNVKQEAYRDYDTYSCYGCSDPATTVTTEQNDLVFDYLIGDQNTTYTPGAGQTQRLSQYDWRYHRSSDKLASGVSSSMTWNQLHGNNSIEMVAVAFKGIQGSTPNSFADRMAITKTGNVGIGTTSPDYLLDVQGGYVNASSGLCINGTCIDSWSAGEVGQTYSAGNDLDLSGSTFNLESQLDYVSVISRASSDLILQTTTSGNIILDPFGNVGIGTTLPSAKLDIFLSGVDSLSPTSGTGLKIVNTASTNSAAGISLMSGSYATSFINFGNYSSVSKGSITYLHDAYSSNSQYEGMMFNVSDGERMRILGNGSVGIGTTAPTEKLMVAGNIAPSLDDTYDLGSATNRWRDLYLGPASIHLGDQTLSNSGGALVWNGQDVVSSTGIAVFNGANINSGALYVDSVSGSVGIGTTAPGAKLDVSGNILLSGSNRYLNFGSTEGTDGYGIRDSSGTLEYKNSSGSWLGLGGLWTDGGGISYLTATGDDLAIGGSTSSASLYMDVSENLLRIGSGSTTDAALNLYASNGQYGTLSYAANDTWNFGSSNGIVLAGLVGAPVSPTAGQLYFNNTTNTAYLYTGSSWVDIAKNTEFYTNSGSVPAGSYLDVTHGQNTTDVIADAWVSNGAVWQNVGTLASNGDEVVDDSLDMDAADESKFDLDDLAYDATLTPSATTGDVTLTLGSGNWNDNARVKKGMRVSGNGGEAIINADPAAQTTITATVTDDFDNTNAIASGDWAMTGQAMKEYNSAEQLVLNDFKNKMVDGGRLKTGYQGDCGNSQAVQIATDKVLVFCTGARSFAMVASASGTNVTYGDPVEYSSGSSFASVTPLGTDKALIAYYDSSSTDGKARVASISGTTITLGSEAIFDTNVTYYVSAAQIGTDKALIAYYDSTSTDGQAIVASVSGTTISYGTETTFDANDLSYVSAAPLSADKALIAYYDSTSTDGQAVVASVSDTTISYGTEATFETNVITNAISTAQLGTDKVLIAYYDSTNMYGEASVATVTGSSISHGSANQFSVSVSVYDLVVSPLADNKALLVYNNGSYDYVRVVSAPSTTVSYGSNYNYRTSGSNEYVIAGKFDTDKAFIAAGHSSTYRSTGRLATVSGTSITLGTDDLFGYNFSTSAQYVSATEISDGKILVLYAAGDQPRVVVATISGSTVSYGTSVEVEGAGWSLYNYNGEPFSIAKVDDNKAVILYEASYSSNYYLRARAVSVSGSTITLGSSSSIYSTATYAYIYDFSVAKTDTNQAVVTYSYYDSSSTWYAKGVPLTVSGTTLSAGSEVVFYSTTSSSARAESLDSDYLAPGKAIFIYKIGSSIYARVASVSGSTLTFGSEVTATSGTYIRVKRLEDDKAIILSGYQSTGNYVKTANVSGTSITLGSSTNLGSTLNLSAGKFSSAVIDANKVAIIYNSNNSLKYLYVSADSIKLDPETYTVSPDYIYASNFRDGFTTFSSGQLMFFQQRSDSYGIGATIFDPVFPKENEYYISATTDQNQLNASYWTNVNAITAAETTNGETIHYAASFDDRETWKIYDNTDYNAGWRPIARNNSGTWQYNSNVSSGLSNVTWAAASTNTQAGALDQAMQVAANQMTGTEMNAVTDDQQEASGGYSAGSTETLDFAIGMKTATGLTPALDGITVAYEQAQYQLQVVDEDTVRFYNNSAGTVTAKIEVSLSGNGGSGGGYWAQATGGINYALGNVGIGTAVPLALLDVNGNAAFGTGAVNSPSLAFRTDLNTGIWSSGADTFNISTGGLERMRIDNNGNIGIGNTNPLAKLSISAISGMLLNLDNAGTSIMSVLSSGYVGIGTTAPDYELDVAGDLGINQFIHHNDDLDTALSFDDNRFRSYIGGKYLLDLYKGVQDYVKLGDGTDVDINLNDSLFVEGSSGNVGIGTTSVGTYKLSIAGTLNATEVYANGVLLSPGTGSNWSVTGSDIYRLSGNVGIGTTDPNYKLDVDGDINISGNYYINGAPLGTGIGGSGSANRLARFSASTVLASSLIYDDGEKVAIGTALPTHLFQISGGNLGLDETSYINFGGVDGLSGYGIRDNNGVLEFKNSGGSWTPLADGLGESGSQLYTNAGTVQPGSYLEVFHNQDTTDVIADAWIWNGNNWQDAGYLATTEDEGTDNSFDFGSEDEANFSQEDLAYSTTLTPSATTGDITLTLGSGNWSDNAKVKSGMRVAGNGGMATISQDPDETEDSSDQVPTLDSNLLDATPVMTGYLIDEIPIMTSNTAPSGTASVSTTYDAVNFDAWRALDSNTTGSYWITANGTTTGWLSYEFSSAKTIKGYSITAYTTSTTAPRDWTFEGWNGSGWDVLDTRTNQTAWGSQEQRVFSISNSTSYIKYRINVTANNGYSSYLVIADFAMSSILQVEASATYNSSTYEAWKAFDSNITTTTWMTPAATPTGWISYDLGVATVVKKYSVRTGATTARAPKDWTLEGWNGSGWDVLDTQTNQTGWTAYRSLEFTLGSPANYAKYRLNVTANNGDANYLEIADIVLSSSLGVSTASGDAGAGAEGYMAFDGLLGANNWSVSGTTGWLAYEFESAKTITKYTLNPGSSSYLTRAPKSWTFDGWNGASWVTLDTKTNWTDWTTDGKVEFPIENSTAYAKYRINVTVNNGDASFLNISEMELLETDSTVTNTIRAVVTDDFDNTDPIASGDWQMYGTEFDGDIQKLVLNDFKDRLGTPTRLQTGAGIYSSEWKNIEATQISANKVLVAYTDTSYNNHGRAIVANIDAEGNISYGNPMSFSTTRATYISVSKLDTDRALISYANSSNYGNSIVATVSGTSISFGTAVQFLAGTTSYITSAQIDTDKVVVSFRDANSYGRAIVATAAGTTVSFGAISNYYANTTSYPSVAKLDTNKFIVAYGNVSGYGNSIVGTVSGTTISYGSGVQFYAASSSYFSVAQLDTNKALVAYQQASGDGYAQVASVSGTTVSFGSVASFYSAGDASHISTARLGADKAIITYKSSSDNFGYAIAASVSGTTISYGSAVNYHNYTNVTQSVAVNYDTDKVWLYAFSSSYSKSKARTATVSGTAITLAAEADFAYAGIYYSYDNDDQINATQIDTDKVLITYQGTRYNSGYAVVATVSGDTVSYGDSYAFTTSLYDTYPQNSVTKIDANKAFIAYKNTSSYGVGIVATISGTAVSFGSEVTFNSNATDYISAQEIGTNKVLIGFANSSSYGNAIVATVSGTTITYGSAAAFTASSTANFISVSKLDTNKAAIAWQWSTTGYMAVATVTGNSVSYGTPAAFNSGGSTYISSTPMDTDKVLIAYRDGGDSYHGNAIVATASGTDVTFGSEATYSTNNVVYSNEVLKIGDNTAAVLFNDTTNDLLKLTYLSVDGSSIDVNETEYSIANYESKMGNLALLDNNKALAIYDIFTTGQDSTYSRFALEATVAPPVFPAQGSYYSVSTTDANQVNISSWNDMKAVTVTETADSATINYAISFDQRATFKVYDTTNDDHGWRPIVRNNTGTWQYNSETDTGRTEVSWTAATVNTQAGALDQAFQVTANQMTGTELGAVTDAQWEDAGGYAPGFSGTLDFAYGFKTDSVSTPSLDQIEIVYSLSHYMLRIQDANSVRFYNNSSEAVTAKIAVALGASSTGSYWAAATGGIHYDSYLGLNTASPVALLDVNGVAAFGTGSALSPSLAFRSDLNTGIWSMGEDILNISTGGVERFRINALGNIGIGTTAPSARVSIKGDGTNPIFNLFDGLGAEKMTVLNSGNVGIGTTAPDYELDVAGDMGINQFIHHNDDLDTALSFDDNRFRGYIGGKYLLDLYKGVQDYVKLGDGTDVDINLNDDLFVEGSSGNVGIGTTGPSAQLHTTGTVRFANFGAGTLTTDANGNLSVSSDERLKDISGEYERGIADLMGIEPIIYKWKDKSGLETEHEYVGFSAQNVQLSIPEAVGEDPRGYLTMNDRPILAAVINGIKQQQAQIEEHTDEILNQGLQLSDLSDKDISVDEKIMVIGESLESLEGSIGDVQSQVDEQAADIATLKEKYGQIESQLSHLSVTVDNLNQLASQLIDFASNHESRIQALEKIVQTVGFSAATELSADLASFDALMEPIVTEGGVSITFTVDGNMKAEGMEAEVMKVAKIEAGNVAVSEKISGKGTIVKGQTEILIETPEVYNGVKIYITPQGSTFGKVIYYEEIIDGQSFKVRIDDSTDRGDIKFDWLIIK